MEDTRLNIDRPLLSVRRFSSITTTQHNENKQNESYIPIRPSIESRKAESRSGPMMNPGNVPFGWEHSPGRPKNEKNKQIQTKENHPSLSKLPPKLPPGRLLKSLISENTREDDDDDDETFMDALDTLSRGETSFYNCSTSGVSGHGSDGSKLSGILRPDPKMRDFMMGRFLPAAKAMASDVPQHIFKKNAIREKPREVKKLVNMENNKQQLRYGPNFVGHDNEEEEEEDSDYDSDEYDERGKSSSKFCGLIPRFCSVNPVRGMCMRARFPVSPANKTQASSSSVSSFSETDNEPARSAVHKHRSLNTVLKNDSIETANLEGSKLYTRLQGRGIRFSEPFQSTVYEQNESTSKKKGLSFKELLADKNTDHESDGQDSIIERTLYVDTIQIIKSPEENSFPSCTKPQSNFFNESLESDMLGDESKQIMKKKCDQDLKGFNDGGFQRPAPPPSPKSPSDSWLCRTLPSVSSKNKNPKCPSNEQKPDENKRCPEGPLHPIPES